jgi:hypothetical protein
MALFIVITLQLLFQIKVVNKKFNENPLIEYIIDIGSQGHENCFVSRGEGRNHVEVCTLYSS